MRDGPLLRPFPGSRRRQAGADRRGNGPDDRPDRQTPLPERRRRQIVAAPASEAFLSYQRHLAERIKAIEERTTKPQKGDDILLSVITDGRHAAIDLRFVRKLHGNEPDNKLNALIDNVHRIWEQTGNIRYTRADGVPYALPGAAQMIFSDLGTLAAEETRGFSAYRWIKNSLVGRGVPAAQIAFMQDYKKSSAKQRLFNAVNGGQVRILIGSSETMGTGVNAQRRLKALHHLDVPWLPSQIEQREGRIERQGNENEEIELYAYATKRSVDATGWQILERKARFIDAAMSGDRSVRRIEDAGSQANQFALAKAIASGDERLMRKAGIASEIARLERLRDSHFDDQFAIRRKIGFGEKRLEDATRRIEAITQDLARRAPTRGDAFTMMVGEQRFTERKAAGEALTAATAKAELVEARINKDLETVVERTNASFEKTVREQTRWIATIVFSAIGLIIAAYGIVSHFK